MLFRSTDRNLAPQLANALMDKLQQIHQALQNGNNKKILNTLQSALIAVQKKLDSLDVLPVKDTEYLTARRKTLLEQQLDYEKLISEYDLIINANSESLLITEKARSSLWPDRPRRFEILSATGILSLLFAFLVAVILEKNKRTIQ